jgi:prevent-host-death family protein
VEAEVSSGVENYDYYDYNGIESEVNSLSTQTWTVAEAKAKFSELLEKAKSEGPQKITKHGRTTAVIVAADQWERKSERKGNLAEFFASSPLRGSGIKIEGLRGRLRRVDL